MLIIVATSAAGREVFTVKHGYFRHARPLRGNQGARTRAGLVDQAAELAGVVVHGTRNF